MPVAKIRFARASDPSKGYVDCWPELLEQDVEVVSAPIEVTGLEDGMQSGKPSVALRLVLSDGRIVVAETSLELFLATAAALKARFAQPDQPPVS